MKCLNPTYIQSPESRLLRKCIEEHRPYSYYKVQSHARRNLLIDPVPLAKDESEYLHFMVADKKVPERRHIVPCGKCEQCLHRKVNDYFVRNYFEWLDCSPCGSTYLITLTYADEYLPRLNDSTPCFDSEHIKLFLKRFRQYLFRKGLTTKNFTYFIVTEFGGELGRPHYHGLFHFQDYPKTEVARFRLIEALAKCWTKLDMRKSWYANENKSLFDCQRVDAQLVDSSQGIRYVCKYVGKQIDAIDFDEFVKDPRYGRFHRQSIGLGRSLTKYVDPDEYRKGLVTIDGYKYALPIYFQTDLKREFLCFHENGSIIYQPTNFARDSVREFTMSKLEEYKELSLINPDFPKPSPILRDPNVLYLLDDWLKRYGQFQEYEDFSYLDDCLNGELEDVVSAINEFFHEVDEYYKPKYEAQAIGYIKRSQELYMKKRHLK